MLFLSSMKHNSTALILVFLVLPGVVAGKSRTYSDVPQIQRLFVEYSSLRTLFKRAEAVGPCKITLDESLPPTSIFQGTTEITGSTESRTYKIHILPGLSDDFAKNLIAHELFHIVIRREGLPIDRGTVVRGPLLTGNFELAVLRDAMTSLANCYADAIIDQRMASLKLNPFIINARKRTQMMLHEQESIPSDPSVVRFYKANMALTLYCLSLRLRDFGMRDIYVSYEPIYPTLEQDVEAIAKKMGTKLCSTGPTCFNSVLQLRDASGFSGEITFVNPPTGTSE